VKYICKYDKWQPFIPGISGFLFAEKNIEKYNNLFGKEAVMKNRKVFIIKNFLFVMLAVFVITGMCGVCTTNVQAATQAPKLTQTSSLKVEKKVYKLKKAVSKKPVVTVTTKTSKKEITEKGVKILQKTTVITTTTTKYAGLKKTVIKEVETNVIKQKK